MFPLAGIAMNVTATGADTFTFNSPVDPNGTYLWAALPGDQFRVVILGQTPAGVTTFELWTTATPSLKLMGTRPQALTLTYFAPNRGFTVDVDSLGDGTFTAPNFRGYLIAHELPNGEHPAVPGQARGEERPRRVRVARVLA